MPDAEGWPDIAALLAKAGARARLLPPDPRRGARTAKTLGFQAASNQYALCLHAGGIVVEDWLVLLAGGGPDIKGDLASWNGLGDEPIGEPIAGRFVVAYDRVGGLFAIDAKRALSYFAPDVLAWETLVEDGGHFALLTWVLSKPGGMRDFYSDARWPGWEKDVAACGFDDAVNIYPPPWSVEGKDSAKVSRTIVPANEVVGLHLEAARQLDEQDE